MLCCKIRSFTLLKFVKNPKTVGYKGNNDRFTTRLASTNILDVKEQSKIFGRLADKMLLLDVPGAGSPEMMNCCQ